MHSDLEYNIYISGFSLGLFSVVQCYATFLLLRLCIKIAATLWQVGVYKCYSQCTYVNEAFKSPFYLSQCGVTTTTGRYCKSHRNIQKLNNDPSVSDGTPLVHCIVIFSYKHHVVMGVSRTVNIMLLQLFILTLSCEKKLKFTRTMRTPISTTLLFSPGENLYLQ